MTSEVKGEELKAKLKDQRWRLDNLYKVVNKKGTVETFKMNQHQRRFYDEMWYCNLILKARQLGMTTFIQILFLDHALFTSNIKCGVIVSYRQLKQAASDQT